MLRTKYSIRIGANPFSRRSVISLSCKGQNETGLALLTRFGLLLARTNHSLDLGIDTSLIDRCKSTDALVEELMAICCLMLQRKSGVEVNGCGQIEGSEFEPTGAWCEISDLHQGKTIADHVGNLTSQFSQSIEDLSDRKLQEIACQSLDLLDRFIPAPYTEQIIAEADRRNIPWRRNSNRARYSLEMGVGKKSMRLQQSFVEVESSLNSRIADKSTGQQILKDAGIRVPVNQKCSSEREIRKAVDRIGYPLVVKPVHGGGARGVTVDVRNASELNGAVSGIKGKQIVIEEFVEGVDYRVFVVNGKAVCCTLREPPSVVGDGKSTIEQLVAEENYKSERGPTRRFKYNSIDFDRLDAKPTTPYRRLGHDRTSVPKDGERVSLSYIPVFKDGAKVYDVTNETHEDYLKIAERAAREIGIFACGIDIIAQDISQPSASSNFWVNEANTHPNLHISIFPDLEEGGDKALLSALYPKTADALVPVILVVTDRASPPITSDLMQSLNQSFENVAVAHRDGYNVGGLSFGKEDHASIHGVRRAIADRSAEIIVSERFEDELMANGMGLRTADIVVFNPGQSNPESFWQRAGYCMDWSDVFLGLSGEAEQPNWEGVPREVRWFGNANDITEKVLELVGQIESR